MALRFRGLDAPTEVVYAKGGGPPVPDPNASIAAQGAANRVNIVGPTGSQTYTQGPRSVIGYDQQGRPLYGQNTTQTTTLSPTAQRQFNTSNQIAETMLQGAQGKIGGPSGLANTSFNYNADIPQVAKDAYAHQEALLAPSFKNADQAFEQKMANQGLPVGSAAYTEALRQHELDKNTALTNAAASAEQQGASLSLSQRQQQYNELAAALGGQQVAPVNAFAGAGAQPLNVAGAYDTQNQARLAGYNAGVSGQNSILGGLTGLGSAYLSSRNPTYVYGGPSAAGGGAADYAGPEVSYPSSQTSVGGGNVVSSASQLASAGKAAYGAYGALTGAGALDAGIGSGALANSAALGAGLGATPLTAAELGLEAAPAEAAAADTAGAAIGSEGGALGGSAGADSAAGASAGATLAAGGLAVAGVALPIWAALTDTTPRQEQIADMQAIISSNSNPGLKQWAQQQLAYQQKYGKWIPLPANIDQAQGLGRAPMVRPT